MTRMICDHDEIAIGGNIAATENFRLQPSVENSAFRTAHRRTSEPTERRRQMKGVGLRELRVRRHPLPPVPVRLRRQSLQVRDGLQVGYLFGRDIAAGSLPDQLADFSKCQRIESQIL